MTGSGMAWTGWLVMIVSVALIGGAVVCSTGKLGNEGGSTGRARALLEEGYAAGEIEREYLQRRADLEP